MWIFPFLCKAQNDQRSEALLWDRCRVCANECVCVLSLKCVAFILLLLNSDPKLDYIDGAALNSGLQCPPLILSL